MAKLLVQLGRKIVREESISEPGKRQFLHDTIAIDEVLSDDKAASLRLGSSSVIGIDLDQDEDITWTSERGFERLSNLQFLSILGRGVNPQSMKYMSRKLRVLSWSNFNMSCFPSSFNPKFLVMLYMPKSKLEKLWEEINLLINLKWMDLSFSERLKELPDLSTATNLQKLDLKYCSSLRKLPSSIGDAMNLQELNLGCCLSLAELPSSIGNAINLKKLYLSHCSSLVELPSSMRNLGSLSELELEECSKLVVNLANINLESLEYLNLSGCSLLKSYHESFTEIQKLDPWIGRISRLRRLVLSRMKKLVSLPPLPDSLLFLDAENCESLERLDGSFRNPDICLNFKNCFQLNHDARDLIIHTPTNHYAIFPAVEVPLCFTHRSSGSSLTVKLNQMPLGKSTKFKACFLCAGEDKNGCCFTSVCCSITSGGNALTGCSKTVGRVFPRNLYTFEVEVETEEMTSTELVFEFEFSPSSLKTFETWEIKECGVLQLLEVSLLSLI